MLNKTHFVQLRIVVSPGLYVSMNDCENFQPMMCPAAQAVAVLSKVIKTEVEAMDTGEDHVVKSF